MTITKDYHRIDIAFFKGRCSLRYYIGISVVLIVHMDIITCISSALMEQTALIFK